MKFLVGATAAAFAMMQDFIKYLFSDKLTMASSALLTHIGLRLMFTKSYILNVSLLRNGIMCSLLLARS